MSVHLILSALQEAAINAAKTKSKIAEMGGYGDDPEDDKGTSPYNRFGNIRKNDRGPKKTSADPSSPGFALDSEEAGRKAEARGIVNSMNSIAASLNSLSTYADRSLAAISKARRAEDSKAMVAAQTKHEELLTKITNLEKLLKRKKRDLTAIVGPRNAEKLTSKFYFGE
jgi:hypothetical protein